MPRPPRPRNDARVRPRLKARKSLAPLCALLALCLCAPSSPVSRGAHAQSQNVSFASPVVKPYSAHGGRVAAGDFDNDGKPDLVAVTGPGVGGGGNNLGLALGNGDGTLRDPAYYHVGIQLTDLSVGDFNLDGKLDVALLDFSMSSVHILLGNGDGTLQDAASYPIAPPPGSLVSELRSITAADFDGDGRLDIAVGSGKYGVCVMRNNGDGTLQSFVGHPLRQINSFAPTANALTSGDFNGDGRADIAVADSSFTQSSSPTPSYVRVLLNDGAGGFGADVEYSAGGRDPRAIAKGDFNGDGKLDLVSANVGASAPAQDGNVAVLFGNGDGTFQSPHTYAASPFTSTTYTSLAVADFDKDGRTDVAAVYAPTDASAHELRVLINDGAGAFRPFASFNAPSAKWVAAADFDGDGRPDAATANDSSLGVFLNDTFVPAPTFTVTMTASRTPAPVGQNFNYNVSVTNDGDGPAADTVMTDVLPAQVTLTAASASQGACAFASATRTVTCQLGTLAAGASASAQLTVKPREEGTLDNTASVAATNYETASASVTGLPAQKIVDVSVSMTDSADPVFVGENTTYTLVLKNSNTTVSATGVTLQDTLPSGMTFVSATTTQGSLVTPPVGSTGTLTANVGTLAPNANATVTVTAKAASSGVQTNAATVSSNETDSNASNNTATQATTVKPAAVVGLQKVLLVKQVLTGGCENTTGNVYLTAAAPAGGVGVTLSSNVSGASVPSSVYVAAGQTVSPAFNVTTSPVASKQTGLVTATSGASSVSRGVTVNVGSGSCP